MGIISKIFGTHSQRELKKIEPIVDKIEALEPEMKKLSDAELATKTPEFKARLSSGETLDDILPEAFAVVREAAVRVLGQRPYRVQLIGGVVLHQGRIAEMKTGEGKTLVATLPAYLNALTGRGVHIVTVNDYLAKRDSEWMGKIHRFLGLKVGLIVHDLSSAERREAYAADITYGTNNEMGFDYLRDNMATYSSELVQRGHVFAIVDEVDSILIDEARTPLIISGKGEASSELYKKADDFASRLRKLVVAETDEKQQEAEDIDADYVVDEKARTATLTARGIKKAEAAFEVENLYDIENATLYHYITNAIKARGVMKRDIDYIVKDGEVVIVDEFTGRLMFGRRYNEGLHQAIEAKEGVDVANESKTLATITFQNFFRLYEKLSGMTGTALTEEEEFNSIYSLDIIEIPTNRPVIRIDHEDVVYKNENGKNRAIIEQIESCHAKGQPVLVGTVSIEKSEYISSLLKKKGIPHNVLNAKQHEREAEIVAQAGKVGAVTIATNMAGRGTDIVLGGNPEFMAKQELRKRGMEETLISETTSFAETADEGILAARAEYNALYAEFKKETELEAEQVRNNGGLFILGTERHESRRIDNQLRGRAGRQGDPGESRFFLAMTDDIMRLFGAENVRNMMDTLGLNEDTPIDHKILSNAIENAQKRVESRNFQVRKTVLEYDDVMNQQREIIYAQRRQVLNGENMQQSIRNMLHEDIRTTVNSAIGENGYFADRAQFDELMAQFEGVFIPKGALNPTQEELNALNAEDVIEKVTEYADAVYAQREQEFGTIGESDIPLMRELERVILLRVVDEYWMDHIDAMQDLRQGISLRAYGQTKPIDAYKNEGYEMFEQMVGGIRHETVRRMMVARIKKEEKLERKKVATVSNDLGGDGEKKQPIKKVKKPGRNDPCPCGRWKADGSRPLKYKECCGRNE